MNCKVIDFPIPFIDRSSKYIQSDCKSNLVNMLMVRLKLSYCYNYIKLVNGKAKIKLLLQLHSNIELMTEHDLRLDMCFPYTPPQD